MSLINEALKKAQRDRHLENIPAPAAGSSRSTARSATGPSKSTLILIGTGVVALFVVAVVGAVLFINRAPAAKVIPSTASAAASPAPKSRPAEAPSPAAASPITAAPAPLSPASSAPAATVPPPIVISLPTVPATKSEPVSPASTPAIAPVKVEALPPAPAADKFDPRLQTMVDGWHINLVRVAGPDSRLFMNGTSYRIGDTIDRTSGLKLTEVSATTLTFTDSAGSTYSKRH